MKKDSLGDRMKGYENISRNYLTRRTPVIIRLDGKAFHTFTKGMKKPFDEILMKTMKKTMKYLCENIQGCVLGYTQSDEITLVLTDYEKITTDAWFGYNIQKMASVSSSMATLAFNKYFREEVDDRVEVILPKNDEYLEKMELKYDKAMFDSRVFSIPKEEVCNCLIWRQQDATRNSIQSVGQSYFSSKKLKGKSCNEIQDMLFTDKGINWNDFPVDCKRGSCCYKVETPKEFIDPNLKENKSVMRSEWCIDSNIPIFTQDRDYVDRWL